jgi:hypothetical protein
MRALLRAAIAVDVQAGSRGLGFGQIESCSSENSKPTLKVSVGLVTSESKILLRTRNPSRGNSWQSVPDSGVEWLHAVAFRSPRCARLFDLRCFLVRACGFDGPAI